MNVGIETRLSFHAPGCVFRRMYLEVKSLDYYGILCLILQTSCILFSTETTFLSSCQSIYILIKTVLFLHLFILVSQFRVCKGGTCGNPSYQTEMESQDPKVKVGEASWERGLQTRAMGCLGRAAVHRTRVRF